MPKISSAGIQKAPELIETGFFTLIFDLFFPYSQKSAYNFTSTGSKRFIFHKEVFVLLEY